MPQLIKYLDKIAREKQRDVLMLSFIDTSLDIDDLLIFDYEQYKPYVEVIKWLDENHINWCRCALQPSLVITGQLYIDVPYDTKNLEYQKLASYLENPDGSMIITGIRFGYMPLWKAMEYAYQDEPGYWDKVTD